MHIKYLMSATLLLSFISIASAQLPPVFDLPDSGKPRKSQLTVSYISPIRIVLKSAEGGAFLKNDDALLRESTGQADLVNRDVCVLKSDGTDKPYMILDFGKEIHGGIRIVTGNASKNRPVKLRFCLGESVSEAMSNIGQKGATNDHAIRDMVFEIPKWGTFEFGNSGFRFATVELIDPDTEIQIKEISAKFVYQDIPYIGAFRSNDELLNQIWMTGAYTVHLNLQDYLWDGIKRDRLVWIGDIHPEVATVNAVFGYNASVPRSLDLARDITPLPEWMNGHSSYSLWWIITHRDWYMHHGDLDYLREQKDYLIPLLRLLSTMMNDEGREMLGGVRFLDWPSSGNPEAVHAGLQALLVWALSAGKDLCLVLGEKETATECTEAIEKLRKYTPKHSDSKQAAALLSLAELTSPDKAAEIIGKNGVQNFSTFYGYYMLQALANSGNYDIALESIRQYWGGMLSAGATTFWEDFDISWLENSSRIDEIPLPGKKDIHGDYGNYCYNGLRHSLCHGWASGPTAWLSEHVLGIKVLEAGCRKIRISPNLGNLEFVEGEYPTPFGVVKVKHTKGRNGKIHSQVDAPKEVQIIR